MYSDIEDKLLIWDLIICELRRATIAYSKNQARLKREETELLTQELSHLEIKLTHNPTDSDIDKYQIVKSELDKMYTTKAAGAQVRAKAESIEFGEKNSRYFANLEKAHYKSKHITALTVDNRDITTPDDILIEEKKFYEALYTRKNTDKEAEAIFLDKNIQSLPKLTKDDQIFMDTPISLDEITKALKTLPNGKSPGSDGFTTEYYKMFWPHISKYVIDSFNHASETGKLSIDQRRGIITLTPKKGKDLKDLKNWRPITLLNTDFKILAKTFGIRMQKVLQNIISSDQVGYLPGRYIGQNIRLIQDVIDFCNDKQHPGVVAFLDFEKAFDSVEWSFIQKSLQIFNFGENFRNWINVLYCDITACVTNNGYSSESFKPSRGIRQGCPLSVYLFLLVVELLATEIRSNNNINGIKIGEGVAKITQMADDTTVFVSDYESLQRILETMSLFEKASGLRLNKGKTEAMWLGIKGHRKKGLGLKWQEDSIFSLGVHFCQNKINSEELNLTQSLDRCLKCLDIWSRRHLSIIGRITVIKSFALPKLLYAMTNLPISEAYVKAVNKMFYKFLWEGKPDKVKRTTIEKEYHKGGLKMINIEHMIKATKALWVKRLVNDQKATWTLYLRSFLDIPLEDAFKSSFSKTCIPFEIPDFYHQVFYAWAEVKELSSLTNVNDCWSIRREYISYNKNLMVGGDYYNSYWGNDLHNADIKIIHDICKDDGSFLTKIEIENKYHTHLCDMAYNSLICAIPKLWKTLLKKQKIPENAISSNESITLSMRKTVKPLASIVNRELYTIYSDQNKIEPNCKKQWAPIFDISDTEWKSYFEIAKADRNAKIKSFQFKIIHNIFPCNKTVSHWNESVHSNCYFCNDVEDLCHYFYNCPCTRQFWDSLQTWINNIGINHTFSCQSVLLGVISKVSAAEALNFTILQAKWYIYRKKMDQCLLKLPEFLQTLKYRLEAEKRIYIKSKRLSVFKEIFSHIVDFD